MILTILKKVIKVVYYITINGLFYCILAKLCYHLKSIKGVINEFESCLDIIFIATFKQGGDLRVYKINVSSRPYIDSLTNDICEFIKWIEISYFPNSHPIIVVAHQPTMNEDIFLIVDDHCW